MKHLAVFLGMVACGSGNAGAPDAAIDAQVFSGTFMGSVADSADQPIGGAQFCIDGLVHPDPDCVTSAGDGTYTITIAIPAGNTNVAALTTAPGYLGHQNLLVESSPLPTWEDTGGGLYSEADATTLLATKGGFTYPSATTGFFRVDVLGNTLSVHATVAIDGSDATPVYSGSDGEPNGSAVDTSWGGYAYFGNLPPGIYPVTVTAPGLTCSAIEDGSTIDGEWPPVGSETLSVGVAANAMTVGLVVQCN